MNMTPVIAKQHYFKPGAENRIELKKFLRYLTHRDGAQQWVDRGMGASPDAILHHADQKCSRYAQMRDIALPPDPYLWPYISPERRHTVMARVAERSIEAWFRLNHWGEAEYSYILHEKEEDESEKLHAHIVLPGTIQPDPLLRRRHHRIRPPHLEDLRRTASAYFLKELERELGPERLQEVLRERDERIERERAAKRELERKEKGQGQNGLGKPDQRIGAASMGDVSSVLSLMKQESDRKARDKKSMQARKKSQRRADERKFRLYMKQQARQQRAATRRQAREDRLAAREREHQEQLAQLRREEEERNHRGRGFSRDWDIDL